ncbi:MAG: GatB/YqeY domain-containing protein [Candidatus Dojkabacteria bacterium]
MSLLDILRKDMFLASKEGNREKSDILKMVIASVKNYEIDTGKTSNDTDIEKILRKEVKKVKDSIEQFEKMGREDLLAIERIQLEVLESYLPELMSEDDVKAFVQKKMKELGIESNRDMGKLIGAVMKELNGKADGSVVKSIVESLLG